MCAFREMIDNMALPREFCAPSSDLSPGVIGLGGGESAFPHLPDKKTAAAKVLLRQVLGIPQASRNSELGTVYRLPGAKDCADDLAKCTCDMAPFSARASTGPILSGRASPFAWSIIKRNWEGTPLYIYRCKEFAAHSRFA